jgi:hypothetical protein
MEAEGFAVRKVGAGVIPGYGDDESVTITQSHAYEKVLIVPSAQTISYGDDTFKFTTGDETADKELGLKTKVDVSKLSVGEYALNVLIDWDNDNYSWTFGKNTSWAGSSEALLTIKPRNAKIVLKGGTVEYTGKEIDPQSLYSEDGALNGDSLNVIVNSVGNKILLEPGTYTLVATANNANYSVAEVTAELTIVPRTEDLAAAQKVIDQINKLGSNPTKKDVEAARAAFAALTSAQQAIVIEKGAVKTLEEAEAKIVDKEKEVAALVKTAETKAAQAAKNPTAANIKAAQNAVDAAKKAGATNAQLKTAKNSLVKAANTAAAKAVKTPNQTNINNANAAIKAASSAGASAAELKTAKNKVKKAKNKLKKKATVKVSKKTVKKGKKTVVKVTSNAKAKITITAKNKRAKKQLKGKKIKIKNAKTAKITFTKKAKKGVYSFKVVVKAKGNFKKTTKTIKIKVK